MSVLGLDPEVADVVCAGLIEVGVVFYCDRTGDSHKPRTSRAIVPHCSNCSALWAPLDRWTGVVVDPPRLTEISVSKKGTHHHHERLQVALVPDCLTEDLNAVTMLAEVLRRLGLNDTE